MFASRPASSSGVPGGMWPSEGNRAHAGPQLAAERPKHLRVSPGGQRREGPGVMAGGASGLDWSGARR